MLQIFEDEFFVDFFCGWNFFFQNSRPGETSTRRRCDEDGRKLGKEQNVTGESEKSTGKVGNGGGKYVRGRFCPVFATYLSSLPQILSNGGRELGRCSLKYEPTLSVKTLM